MVSHLDHITIVVRDVEKAKEFFGSISGEKFAQYMNVPGIKAEPPVIPAPEPGSSQDAGAHALARG